MVTFVLQFKGTKRPFKTFKYSVKYIFKNKTKVIQKKGDKEVFVQFNHKQLLKKSTDF